MPDTVIIKPVKHRWVEKALVWAVSGSFTVIGALILIIYGSLNADVKAVAGETQRNSQRTGVLEKGAEDTGRRLERIEFKQDKMDDKLSQILEKIR
jgi:hypothetical protein